MAGLVAPWAAGQIAGVGHASAGCGPEVAAHLRGRAAHVVARLLAARRSLARALWRVHAAHRIGPHRRAEHVLVAVLDRLLLAAVRAHLAIVGHAVVALAATADRDELADLAARAGILARAAGLGALAVGAGRHAVQPSAAERRLVRSGHLVDLAVAVVVLAVAGLGLGADASHADEQAVEAGVNAGLAGPHGDPAGVTDAGGRGRERIGRAVHPVRCRPALVGGAVTVVVDAVADLGLRADAADALPDARHDTLELPLLAGPLGRVGVRVQVRVVGHRTRSPGGDVVIDRAVAVVVQVVADLGDRRNVAHAIEDPVDAGDHPFLALAHVGAADATAARVALVDLAVTVVVDPVAHLGTRADGIEAYPAVGTVAGQRALVARRGERPDPVTAPAGRRAPRQVREGAAVAGQVPAPGRGRRIGQRLLVDLGVTVVVRPVADLGIGADAALAHQHAVDTLLGAR